MVVKYFILVIFFYKLLLVLCSVGCDRRLFRRVTSLSRK